MELKERQIGKPNPQKSHGRKASWLKSAAVLVSFATATSLLPACAPKHSQVAVAVALSSTIRRYFAEMPVYRCSELINRRDSLEGKLQVIRRMGTACIPDHDAVNLLRTIALSDRLTDELRMEILRVCENLYIGRMNSDERHEYAEIAASVFMGANANLKTDMLNQMEFDMMANDESRRPCFFIDLIGFIALEDGISGTLWSFAMSNLERALDSPNYLSRRESWAAFGRIFVDENTDDFIRDMIYSHAARALEGHVGPDNSYDIAGATLILRMVAVSPEASAATREEIVDLLEERSSWQTPSGITDALFDIAINADTERPLKERILNIFIERLPITFCGFGSSFPAYVRTRLKRIAESPLTEEWMSQMAIDGMQSVDCMQ